MDIVAEHGGRKVHGMAHQIITNDGDGDAGRAQVFLCTGKNQTKFADVIPFGQNIGAHITNHRHAFGIRNHMIGNMGAVNGVI